MTTVRDTENGCGRSDGLSFLVKRNKKCELKDIGWKSVHFSDCDQSNRSGLAD